MRDYFYHVLFVIASLVVTSFCQAGNIKYQVNPVTLSDGYAVSGGFITTDGTIGPLAVSNILDFEFEVAGPYPYTFTPTSSVAVIVGIEGQVLATAEEIYLPPDLDPSGDRNRLTVYVDVDGDNAYENNIKYFSGTEVADDVIQSYTLISTYILTPEGTKAAVWRVEPSSRLSMASVPEPATSPMLLIGIVSMTIGSRNVACP